MIIYHFLHGCKENNIETSYNDSLATIQTALNQATAMQLESEDIIYWIDECDYDAMSVSSSSSNNDIEKSLPVFRWRIIRMPCLISTHVLNGPKKIKKTKKKLKSLKDSEMKPLNWLLVDPSKAPFCDISSQRTKLSTDINKN